MNSDRRMRLQLLFFLDPALSRMMLFVTPAGPAGAWLVNFANSADQMHMTFSSVTIALVIMILVLLFTVSTQIRKVMNSNPVDGLKVE